MLTLALHELATNAIKYGALSQPHAQLSVRWSIGTADGTRQVTIRWAETGVTMPPAGLDGKRGFGRELIERALPYDLGAETEFELAADGGVRCGGLARRLLGDLRAPGNAARVRVGPRASGASFIRK